jgi:hypothetical protein
MPYFPDNQFNIVPILSWQDDKNQIYYKWIFPLKYYLGQIVYRIRPRYWSLSGGNNVRGRLSVRKRTK